VIRKWTLFSLILVAVTVLAVPVSPKDTVVESQWAAAPVKIGGLEQDWQDSTFLTDGGSKAQYALKNDGKNLYIIFRFKDPMSPSTIEFTGLKVFFNTEGKKSTDLGIHFAKKRVTADTLIAYMEKKGETLTDARKAEIRKQSEYILFAADVIDVKKVPAPSDPAVQTDPPLFSAKFEDRVPVYEFRIPLSRTNQPGGLGSEPGKTVKLGFEWGGLTQEILRDMMAAQSARAGMMSQDAGMELHANDTDSSRGMRAGGEYHRDPRTRFHSFWIDVKLATQ